MISETLQIHRVCDHHCEGINVEFVGTLFMCEPIREAQVKSPYRGTPSPSQAIHGTHHKHFAQMMAGGGRANPNPRFIQALDATKARDLAEVALRHACELFSWCIIFEQSADNLHATLLEWWKQCGETIMTSMPRPQRKRGAH